MPKAKSVPLRQDPYVEALRPRPTDPAPDVVELRGYLGEDTAKGYWRVYLSADLAAYLRLAETDIVDVHRPDGPDADLVPSRIIVRASAAVESVTSLTLDRRASFLRGQYTASLSDSARLALGRAAASTRRGRWLGALPVQIMDYPHTPGFPCRPESTVEWPSCFCTIFCEILPE